MATINVLNPATQSFQNLPLPAVSGDVALVNILIEMRVLSQLVVLNSRGIAITDDLQKLRIDEANSPV